MLLPSALLLSAALGSVQAASIAPRDPPPYYGAAEQAFRALQKWYNQDTGLWQTTNWWNAANCLTVIGDLRLADGNIDAEAAQLFPNTFTKAQLTPARLRTKRGLTDPTINAEDSSLDERGFQGFLNEFYDDEGWWALAWIQVYDVTKDAQYLNMAGSIFADIQKGWTGNCTTDAASGGGLWWNKSHKQLNSIGNSLYLSIAAHLANRQAENKQAYSDIADNTWRWLRGVGLQNSSSLMTDKLNFDDCKPTGGDGWSYNQGVIIGGLVELSAATGNNDYLTQARAVADAYIEKRQATGGIARDNCEPDGCSGDQTQFKGVFMRNLARLWKVGKEQKYKDFIINNADSIRAHDTNADNQLGLMYTGPVTKVDASTQSSALDALVAAIVVSA